MRKVYTCARGLLNALITNKLKSPASGMKSWTKACPRKSQKHQQIWHFVNKFSSLTHLIATLFTNHWQKTGKIFIRRDDFKGEFTCITIFVIFLLSGWLRAHKVIEKSCKIDLQSRFIFVAITTKISNEPMFLASSS